MSYTMRSPTTLMPRFAYLEFLDNFGTQVLQRKANILLVIAFLVLLLLLLLLYKLML